MVVMDVVVTECNNMMNILLAVTVERFANGRADIYIMILRAAGDEEEIVDEGLDSERLG